MKGKPVAVDDQMVSRLAEAVTRWQHSRAKGKPPVDEGWRRQVRLVGVVTLPQVVGDLSETDVEALCALLDTAAAER